MAFHRQRPQNGPRTNKTDVIEYPMTFDHVSLLFNEPLDRAELLFIESSDDFESTFGGAKTRGATARQENFTVSTEKGK